MIPDIIQAGLKLVELFGKIKTRDPKERAANMRARSENLARTAEAMRTESQRHELNALNNPSKASKRHHRRMMRRSDRKAFRLQGRSLYWANRAARLETKK